MKKCKNPYSNFSGWGLFLAGALLLGSCTEDETMQTVQGEAIGFGDVFVENSTRAAADPSYGANKPVDQFNVWGTVTGNTNNTVTVFEGATVTKGTAAYGAAWTCNQTEYWIPNATYKFMAISNATSVTPATGIPTAINYTADGNTDLLLSELTTQGNKEVKTDATATPTTGVNAQKVVEFTMSHLLSKVVFTFNNTDTETALKVKEIMLTGTSTAGTYTLATATWSATNNNYELGFGEEVTINPASEGTSELERLIIPGTYETLGITFKVNDEEEIGEEQFIEATINNQTFVAGHSYNITANIKSGMKEIIFNVTSAAWGETVDDEINIQ